MMIVVWIFRFLAIPFGVTCLLVALDVLHVWGVERRGHKYAPTPPPPAPHFTPGHHPAHPSYLHASQSGVRPHPNAWVWWHSHVLRPAFLLVLLALALMFLGVLLWLPRYGSVPFVSERAPYLTLLVFGLILLRGTFKISSPVIWRKMTFIKWPWGGRARPSVPWILVGLVLCVFSLYQIMHSLTTALPFIDPGAGEQIKTILEIAAVLTGGLACIGVEGIVQSFQENQPAAPQSFLNLGVGLLGLLVSIVGGKLF
jgi:hypothetical protein